MLKNIYEKTKYEGCILLFLLAQLFVFLPNKEGIHLWEVAIYLTDYSRGYMPRALLGEIITWFSDTVTLELFYGISVVSAVLLCLAAAIFGGYLIKNIKQKNAVIAILAVMLGSPVFMPLFSSWLGLMDVYLIILTFIAFAFNENKFLRFSIPVIALVCTAIHHAYLFLYMVPLAIALLYDFFKNKKYVRDGILCGVTYISLIAMGLFTVKTRSSNGYNSIDEIIDAALSKTDIPIPREWLQEIVPNEYMTGVDYLSDKFAPTMTVANLLGLIAIFAPLFAVFGYCWIKALKNSSDKAEKFTFFLCLIHPLSTVPAYIFGLNWNRWTSAIITSQCILFLFMLYRKNESVEAVFEKILLFFKKHFAIIVFYIIYVASFAKLLGM